MALVQCRIEGTSLIMANGRMMDPRDPYVREFAKTKNKNAREKTDSDIEEERRIQFQGSLWFDDETGLGPVLPSETIQALVRDGAKKAKLGKAAEAGSFPVEDYYRLDYDGPRTREELWADDRFPFFSNTKRGVICTRAKFRNWSCTFTLEVDEDVIAIEKVENALRACGKLVGVGSWKPRHGRFVVTEFKRRPA